MPVISLMLAFAWFAFAVGTVLMDYYDISSGRPEFDAYRRLFALLAFVLFAYNLFRFRYAMLQRRLREQESAPDPYRRRPGPRLDENRPRDPNFDFTDPPKEP